jgi:hypothetical protein
MTLANAPDDVMNVQTEHAQNLFIMHLAKKYGLTSRTSVAANSRALSAPQKGHTLKCCQDAFKDPSI